MNFKGIKVCITGGAGFLGSHLTEALLARGAEVTIVDNYSTGSQNNLKNCSKATIVEENIKNRRQLKEAIGQSEIVYHLAANPSIISCEKDFRDAVESNIYGTYNVLSHCGDQTKRFIFISSTTVYGNSNSIPISESQITDPVDNYSVTKLAGESLVKRASHNQHIAYTIIRKSNTYGYRQTIDYFIPTLITQALKKGVIEIWDSRPVREYMFIEDTTRALVRIAECETTKNETLNLSYGQGISSGELAELISQILGVDWIDTHKQQPVASRIISNNSKLKALTGWQPQVSMEEGLTKTIDYWKDKLGG